MSCTASLIPSVFTDLPQLVLGESLEGEEDPHISLEDLSKILFPLISSSPGEDDTPGALKFQPVLIMIKYNLIFIFCYREPPCV